jgi:hypothetical protein
MARVLDESDGLWVAILQREEALGVLEAAAVRDELARDGFPDRIIEAFLAARAAERGEACRTSH